MIQQRSDIAKTFNAFITLMNTVEKSVFHSKPMQIHDLQLVDGLYIHAQIGEMSYLGSSVLVVATISVKSPDEGLFKELLSKLKETAETNKYILKIENATNAGLREFLIRGGFSLPGERRMCDSGYWVPSSFGLNDHLPTLPV